MNLTVLQYIVALDTHRNFVKAAEACGVTQPTLSTMVKNLEDELDTVIFDRSAHPICPTKIGERIIALARKTLSDAASIEELAKNERGIESGTLTIGIIPTIAPYILPKLFRAFHKDHPGINLKVAEMRTSVLTEKLLSANIEVGILATPLDVKGLLEIPVYYEKFAAYISPTESISKLPVIRSEEIPTEHLWVLQEGHCLRNQVFNFCHHKGGFSSEYEAGSIDTLLKIVDENGGYTIIPELHLGLLNERQLKNVRPLVINEDSKEAPVREVSLVIREDYVKERMLNILADEIKKIIPDEMLDSRLKKFAIKI